tara:strand:- start:734 stop:1588 length:855 start_codon:yes stop_codon:yes gene_type:complete
MENTPEKKKKTLTGIRPIRTYQDDIAQAVNKQQEDLISIRTKEQERKNREGFVTQPIKKESSGNSLLFIALFLIVLGLIVIGALWWTSRPQIEETQIIDTILLTDSVFEGDAENMSQTDFKTYLSQALLGSHEDGHIRYFNLTQNGERISADTLFDTILKTRIPPALLRTMGETMIGSVTVSNENIPFILVEVSSFENAFAGLLQWENFMKEDLSGTFVDETATLQDTFTDKVAQNKDLRVLQNTEGNEELIYALLDTKTLLITKNTDAFRVIFPLFISSQQIR